MILMEVVLNEKIVLSLGVGVLDMWQSMKVIGLRVF